MKTLFASILQFLDFLPFFLLLQNSLLAIDRGKSVSTKEKYTYRA